MNKLLLTTYALLVLPFCSMYAYALDKNATENTETAPWYEVEVILFSRNNDSTSEQWPHDLNLSYSANRVQLITEPDNTTSSSQEATDQPGSSATLREDATPTAYQPAPPEQRKLHREAQAINRKKGYKVLFHENWVQPVFSDEDAPSVVISGGEKYGEHHTLEGEITLSVARYLHLKTNLWLSEFEMNYGQLEHRTWPELPATPFKSLKAVEPVDFDNFEAPEFKLQLSELKTDENNDLGLLRETYLPSEIIHIEQHRRMRSKELHYIDHPRFGIIVKILPTDTPS